VFPSNAAAVQRLLEAIWPPVSDVRLMTGDFVESDPGSADAAARTGRACQRTGCPNEVMPSVVVGGPGGVSVGPAIFACSADEDVATTFVGAATM